MNQNTSEKPPRAFYPLAMFISILVAVHFLFTLAFPLAFIYEMKPFLLFSENAWDIWVCQPLFIAIILVAVRSTSKICGMLVYIDVGVSVLQQASVVFLYEIVDKIG